MENNLIFSEEDVLVAAEIARGYSGRPHHAITCREIFWHLYESRGIRYRWGKTYNNTKCNLHGKSLYNILLRNGYRTCEDARIARRTAFEYIGTTTTSGQEASE